MHEAALQIYCCRLADVGPALFAGYHALLDAQEQQRLTRFHIDGARREYLLSRALLRTALAAQFGTEPAALRFVSDDDGKPQLAAPFSDWHFNLSHSAEWVALALSGTGPVGIDIESHARPNDLAAIARRFFSQAENAALQRDPPGSALWIERFFAIWTLKEAHAKALGCGLSKILSCSSFVPAAQFPAATRSEIELQLTGIAAPAQSVSTWLYRADARTSLAISQLGTPTAQPVLRHWLPQPDGTATSSYSELVPIAAGSWCPVGRPTQNARPCA